MASVEKAHEIQDWALRILLKQKLGLVSLVTLVAFTQLLGNADLVVIVELFELQVKHSGIWCDEGHDASGIWDVEFWGGVEFRVFEHKHATSLRTLSPAFRTSTSSIMPEY
jgi:hypothetical protein